MNDRNEGLPIEPLPDLSWQRIERNLFNRLAVTPAPARQRSRRRVWLATGAIAAAAAVIALALVSRGGSSQPAADDRGGRAPSRIATGEAPSAVSVRDVSLEIAPHSALLVDDERDRGVLIILERGEVTCRVTPVRGGPPVVVQAGEVRIEVIGTAFAVSRDGDSARVVVYEGVVSLVERGQRSEVRAGQVWPAAPVPDPATSVPDPDNVSGSASGADSVGGNEVPTREREPARKSPTDRAHRQPPLAAPAKTDMDRYKAAAALEGSDPEAALVAYARLARGSGAWAANALYAQALLEHRLGRAGPARSLLTSYLRRHPRGLNADDARELLKQIDRK